MLKVIPHGNNPIALSNAAAAALLGAYFDEYHWRTLKIDRHVEDELINLRLVKNTETGMALTTLGLRARFRLRQARTADKKKTG